MVDETGRKQYARYPNGELFLAKMNVQELVSIADVTRGKFYQAQNTDRLRDIFLDIDKLEKTKLTSTVNQKSSETFMGLGWLLVSLLLGYRYLIYAKLRYAV